MYILVGTISCCEICTAQGRVFSDRVGGHLGHFVVKIANHFLPGATNTVKNGVWCSLGNLMFSAHHINSRVSHTTRMSFSNCIRKSKFVLRSKK